MFQFFIYITVLNIQSNGLLFICPSALKIMQQQIQTTAVMN